MRRSQRRATAAAVPSAAAQRPRPSARPTKRRRDHLDRREREEEEEDQEDEEDEDDEPRREDGDGATMEERSPRSAAHGPPRSRSPPSAASESADERRVHLATAYLRHLRRKESARRTAGNGPDSVDGPHGDGEHREGQGEEDGAEDEEEEDEAMEDVVSHRLLADADAAAAHGGRLRALLPRYRCVGGFLSSSLHSSLPGPLHRRGHRLSVTATALRSDDRRLYSASKDGSIIEWDVDTSAKLTTWTHREGRGRADVLGLAASSDGRFLASGGMDGVIRVWDTRTGEAAATSDPLHPTPPAAAAPPPPPPPPPSAATSVRPPLWCSFPAHRSAVSCLSFRLGSSTLFSGSYDRTVKLFDVLSKSYVETLFGHTQPVNAVHASASSAAQRSTKHTAQHSHSSSFPCCTSCSPLLYAAARVWRLHRNRAVSVGADRTARMWKVVEESQLLFRMDSSASLSAGAVDAVGNGGGGGGLSLDCVALLDEEHFLVGGDDGRLALWSSQRKRPLHVQPAAHGACHWIVSIGAAPYSDVAFTGSSDGFINAYHWTALQGLQQSRLRNGEERSTPGRPRLELLHRIPCVGYVNSLSVSHSGRFLVAGIGQEHRAGRWMPPIKEAKNGITVRRATTQTQCCQSRAMNHSLAVVRCSSISQHLFAVYCLLTDYSAAFIRRFFAVWRCNQPAERSCIPREGEGGGAHVIDSPPSLYSLSLSMNDLYS